MEKSAINEDIKLQKKGVKVAVSKATAAALVLMSSLVAMPLVAADASGQASVPEPAARTKTVSAKESKTAPTADTKLVPLTSASNVPKAAGNAGSSQENALVQQIIGMCGKVSPQTVMEIKNTTQGATFTISSASKEDISLIQQCAQLLKIVYGMHKAGIEAKQKPLPKH